MRSVTPAAVLLLAGALSGCFAMGDGEHDCHVTGHHLVWVQPGLGDVVRAWPADDPRVFVPPQRLRGLAVDPDLMPGGANASLTWITQHVEHGSVTLEGYHEEGPVLFLHWAGKDKRALVRADVASFVDLVSRAPAANRTAAVDDLMAGWDEGHATTAWAPLPLDVDPVVANLTWVFAAPGQWASHERPYGGLAAVTVWHFGNSIGAPAIDIDAAGGVAGPSDRIPEEVQEMVDVPALENLTREAFALYGLPEPQLAGATVVEQHDSCE